MKDAAARHEFEEAARYRNRLTAVRHLAERQVGRPRRLADAATCWRRRSRTTPRTCSCSSCATAGWPTAAASTWTTPAASRSRRCCGGSRVEYYGGQVAIPPSVIVPSGFEDADLLADVPVRAARQRGRGAGRPARREAAAGRAGRAQRRDGARARPAGRPAHARAEGGGAGGAARAAQPGVAAGADRVLRHLQPGRVEHGGVDGRVRGRASPSAPTTASSRIRHGGGQDDFASMAEAVGRRFARMARSTADEFDASFATAPNLVVIDGGKGQLGAALKAMAEHDLPRVAVIALAKREEEVYVPGRPDAVVLRARLAGPAAAAADPRRGPPVRARLPPPAARAQRRSTRSSTAARRRPGPAQGADAALQDRRRAHRRLPRGPRGGAGAAAQGRARASTRRCTRPADRSRRPCTAANLAVMPLIPEPPPPVELVPTSRVAQPRRALSAWAAAPACR